MMQTQWVTDKHDIFGIRARTSLTLMNCKVVFIKGSSPAPHHLLGITSTPLGYNNLLRGGKLLQKLQLNISLIILQ
ncbi:hypothetical protein XELAEV_18044184mg [Xenopus laevis]|uniref:Uncharacterized protein n=1 Tax=Xenopus laevis TaxID=8355 RepID=A0A974BY20_XENLA|nr:hypothetical protein XELAEV_18044184mg [Xenopus laevis]